MTFSRFFLNSNLAERFKNFTITHNYFFILFGFLGGNLCGSFFYILSLPPFFIIIGFILCLELFSYSYYKTIKKLGQVSEPMAPLGSKKNQKKFSWAKWTLGFWPTTWTVGPPDASPSPLKLKFLYLYLIKIGFLFGIFVDAFKVGS